MYCKYFLKKNGKYLYFPINNFYSNYLCILNKITIAYPVSFPNLYYAKNENDIINKLLIFNYIKKNNIKYIKLNNNFIYLFNNNIENSIEIGINLLFLAHITSIDKKLYDYFYGNIVKTLTTCFMISRIRTRFVSDKKILINIFYEFYISSYQFKNELEKKYNKTIRDFENYNKLYIFLKKTGFIDRFYNNYALKIIKNYKKFYNKILEDDRLKKYKIKKQKEIKNFDIDLLEIIDTHINNNFDKKYIRNKFIELTRE